MGNAPSTSAEGEVCYEAIAARRPALCSTRGAKTVLFVRHAEGEHNAAARRETRAAYLSERYADAPLTATGWRQAAALRNARRAAGEAPPDLVVVSPLTRALETAAAVFGGSGGDTLMVERPPHHHAVGTGDAPPFVAHELCREHLGVHPCDRRRPLAVLREEFPGVRFDEIDEEDVLWKPLERESAAAIAARAEAFLAWLLARHERTIAVVAHSSLFQHMWRAFCPPDAPPDLSAHPENCELRPMVLYDAAAGVTGGGGAFSFPGGVEAHAAAPAGADESSHTPRSSSIDAGLGLDEGPDTTRRKPRESGALRAPIRGGRI